MDSEYVQQALLLELQFAFNDSDHIKTSNIPIQIKKEIK